MTARWAAGTLSSDLIQEALVSTLFLAITTLPHSGGLALNTQDMSRCSIPKLSVIA